MRQIYSKRDEAHIIKYKPNNFPLNYQKKLPNGNEVSHQKNSNH